jgi:outer membrane autotransporter protein
MPALFHKQLANQYHLTITTLLRALGGTTLALGLVFLPRSPALAGQIINIDSDVGHHVYGNGYLPHGDAPGFHDPILNINSPDGNIVNINSGCTTSWSVYGALTYGVSGAPLVTTNGNSVTVNSGGTVETVIGGLVSIDFTGASGITHVTSNDNSVTINNGGTAAGVSGGSAGNGGSAEAIGNSVTVRGTVNGGVSGGDAGAGSGFKSVAANNTVNIDTSGSMTGIGNAYGGYYVVYGGSAIVVPASGSSSAAINNTVTINNGTFNGNIAGGLASVHYSSGNYGDSSTAINNTVTISNGTFNGHIVGGSTNINWYDRDRTRAAAATNNTVNISGGTFNNNTSIPGDDIFRTSSIIGGDASSQPALWRSTATNNTINISGNPTFNDTLIFGGRANIGGDAFTGNTFNLHTAGLSVGGLQNFEYLNFYLPKEFAANETMLYVTDTADLTDGESRSAKVNVGIAGESSPLKIGDEITLIDAGTLTGAPANSTTNGHGGLQGVTLEYKFKLLAENNLLTATVTNIGPREESKALSEGFISGLGMIIQGADLVANSALAMAKAVAAAARGAWGNFGSFGGGTIRNNTGSHVDTRGVSLVAGLAKGLEYEPGRLTLGAFLEYGYGSYDTYNSFSSGAVEGDGQTWNLGGGVLGRYDFSGNSVGHFYTEASLRAGGVKNEYRSGDLGSGFDSSSAYYGLHLGTGYVWNAAEAVALDMYGKYFWTRQGGDSVTLATGDPVEFDAVDSHRVRLGARLNYLANETISPYIGAAYEHEFDARAEATAYGLPIDAPSPRGGTGVGEIGFNFKPSPDLPLSFDLGVQGYTGKREGVTGSLQMKWEF